MRLSTGPPAGGIGPQQAQLPPAGSQDEPEAESASLGWLQDRAGQLLKENRLQDLRCDDQANAKRFLLLHGDEVLYCREWRTWLRWAEGRWAPGDLEVEHLAKAVQPLMLFEAAATDGSRRSELMKGTQYAGSARAIQALVFCARSEVAITPRQLDAQPHLLNFTNGTLELTTGILREAKSSDLLTKQVPHAYDPSAKAPRFLEFLEEIMEGDQAMVAFLQRALGGSLLGVVRDHKLFLCVGRGRNGKGTLCRALQSALGDGYCMEAAPHLLLRRRNEPHSTEVAELKGMRLVTCQEIGRDKALDEEAVKRLTGGDRLRARRLYQDNMEFEPSHSLWVFANHKPEIQEAGPAMWRRMTVIPFPFQVSEERMDLDLGEKLKGEAPGILAWLVAGCLEYLQVGLQQPATVTEATADYERDSDSVSGFLEERCRFHEAMTTGARAGELYCSYEEWCQENNYAALGQRAFKTELQQRGHAQKKTNKGQVWVGLLLVEGGG